MELKHRIGENSTFDIDMDLMEMYINCAKEPENVIAQTAVVMYYISQALNYWNKLTEFLNNEDDWPQGRDNEIYTDE